MAIFVLTNAMVLVNSVDLSDHVSKVTVEDTRDQVDVTAMGNTAKAVQKGLGDAKITIDFYQDFATGKVHQTLQPLIGSSTAVPVEARAVNAGRTATNPAFLLSGALLFSYAGLDGAVGDASKMTAEFVNAPTGTGMTYPTS
jgi:hypothetical protein